MTIVGKMLKWRGKQIGKRAEKNWCSQIFRFVEDNELGN